MEGTGIDPRWKGLFRVGGAAALIAAILCRRNLGAEIALLRTIGILRFDYATNPGNIMEWFTLLGSHPLIGLTMLNLFDLINYGLVGLIVLALYPALRRGRESVMAIAAALCCVAVVTYFATNQAFTMLSLSRQFTAATTDAQRDLLLSTGQAVLAMSYGNAYEGEGLYVSFLLVSLAGLMISAVMLRSRIFGRGTAVVGILANAFGLVYYPALVAAPGIIALPISISSVFLLIWYILTGLKLLRLGRRTESAAAQ
ncbi:MAG: hypothetical protein A2177_14595 [Spirochaetes bacterium RBG_13_68_11]|nr:MAG: hypothetical protein A2177_14595 [Spirochaetes bacterium RBG_13_68_11]